MLSEEQRLLLLETKEFLTVVHAGEWNGRPEWRDVLVSRIISTLAKDAEQTEMIGGIRGALTRWLSKGK
jgi:hypothetical protein